MSMMNQLPTEIMMPLGFVNPVSQGAGAVSTGWISVAKFDQFLGYIQSGVLGVAATLDAKFEQATNSSGSGAKDVPGKAISQFTKASNDDNQACINLRAEELDVANGFNHVRLTLTVAAAASLVSATLFGFGARYLPADDKPASVVELVQ